MHGPAIILLPLKNIAFNMCIISSVQSKKINYSINHMVKRVAYGLVRR